MGRGYTEAVPAPTPVRLFLSFLVLSCVLFLRPPSTNFVFDEQEAILANPYLLGDVAPGEVFAVDFWGRSPERTIGSYRPLPNLLWRSLAWTLRFHTPFFLQFWNLLAHAATATLLALTVLRLKRRTDPKEVSEPEAWTAAWCAGLYMTTAALGTEAVSAVVGLADILVGFFCVSLLWCLVYAFSEPAPSRARLFLVGLGFAPLTFLGLLAKETMLVGPLLALTLALLLGLACKTRSPWLRLGGPIISSLSSLAGVVAFVIFRSAHFPAKVAGTPHLSNPLFGFGWLNELLKGFAPPPLPRDVMNNPLLEAGAKERVGTALSLFFEQGVQAVLPWHLSGDYSFPRQGVATISLFGVLGAVILVSLIWFLWRSTFRASSASRELMRALGSVWILVTFAAISGAFVLLPTIRGERLCYLPLVGVSLLLSSVISELLRTRPRALSLVVFFFFLQAHAARSHALIFSDDVTFWRATSRGAPASAKAHLNYGVMAGARGDLDARLSSTELAVRLAPDWPMGRIYLADAWCRKGDLTRARPHYLEGLSHATSSQALTALALQCIWEAGAFESYRGDLQALARQAPDSWLDYLLYRLDTDGDVHQGLPPEYRARGYNRARAGELPDESVRGRPFGPQ